VARIRHIDARHGDVRGKGGPMKIFVENLVLLLIAAVILGVFAHVMLHVFFEPRKAFFFNFLVLLSMLVGGLFLQSKIKDQTVFTWPALADFGFVGVGAVLIAALLALETSVAVEGELTGKFLGFEFSGPAGPLTLVVLLLMCIIFMVWFLTGRGRND
jgi:hypothetical protein